MDLDDRTRAQLMDAGAAAVRFNAPLGRPRAAEIADFVGAVAETIVDLGCGAGAGALLIDTVGRHRHLRGVGLDTAADLIDRATAAASLRSLDDRVRFEVADVTGPVEPADAAICVGATHAFGPPSASFVALHSLGRSAAVVGDGIWTAAPTPEQREMFGDLPTGERGLAELAGAAGWTVVDRGRSTLEEWDEFELGWIGGARSVGTPEAESFAAARLADYQDYRGVLGFGWLFLTR